MRTRHNSGRAAGTGRAGPLDLADALVRHFLRFKLGTLAVNSFALRSLRPGQPLPWPRVSILVPARDEAHNLPRTLPALLGQGAHEVIVLDDQSGDGTGDLARQLGARVVNGEPLPAGWLGKPWACSQLSAVASGDVLIFTDADVRWHPGALDAIVNALVGSRAGLLTVWPRQETGTLAERLVVPLIDDVLLSLLPGVLVPLPVVAASAGNGQLMAFWRSAYRRAGGHALVRGEVLEDVKFAARFKARGGRLAVALGGQFLSVRMYRGYPQAVEGLAKALLDAHLGSRSLLVASWVWHLLAYTLPWVRGRRELVAYALLERLLVNARTGRTRPGDLLEVLLTPLVPLVALPLYLRALQRQYTWKGRTYRRGPTARGPR